MYSENELEIHARIDACEFLIRQLYALRMTDTDNPRESALATQGRAMEALRAQYESLETDEQRRSYATAIFFVNRFYEDLVNRFEAGGESTDAES